MFNFKFTGQSAELNLVGTVSNARSARLFESNPTPEPVEPTPGPVEPTPGPVEPSSASVTIKVRRMADTVAPDAVFLTFDVAGFDVSGPTPPEVYDPTHHELHYVVNWDDPSASFTAPENIPEEWRDANVGYGPNPAHVYQNPGSYRPTVTVIDRSGNWATATVDAPIIVEDPIVIYPTSQTVCVANDGDFEGAPEGCQKATSFSQGWNFYRNLPGDQKGRLLLKRGEVYEDINRIVDSGFNNWYLGDWGDETLNRPVITAQNQTTETISRHFYHATNFDLTGGIRYHNIHLEGLWDPVNEEGLLVAGIICSPGAFTLTNNLSSSGMGATLATTTGTGPTAALVMNNTDIQGWHDIGVFINGNNQQWVGLLGYRATQDPQANMGASGKSKDEGQIKNEHACLRIQKCGRFYGDCFDFFSRNAWEQIHAHPTEQAPIRYHSNDSVSRAFFSRISLEGGLTQFTIGDATSGGTLVPINLVVDKAILVGSAQSKSNFGIGLGGVTRRNILSIMPDTPRPAYGVAGSLMGDTNIQRSTELNRDTPVQIYSNTVVWLKSDANLEGAEPVFTTPPEEQDGFRNTVIENNLTLATQSTFMQTIDNTDVSDFSVAPLWAPRNLGRKYKSYTRGTGEVIPAQLTMDVTYATPPDSVNLYVPEATVPAAASGRVAWDDLLGIPRYDPVTYLLRPDAKQGALEPRD